MFKGLSILDELLPVVGTKSTTPSTFGGTTILDQLLSSDSVTIGTPSSSGPPRSVHRGPARAVKAPSPNSTLNIPILEFLQPNPSLVSIKAAEKLEQFKLQAKLKEEKRKQLRMDEEQRRRERDGLRAIGAMDDDKGNNFFRGENRSDFPRSTSLSSGCSKDFLRGFHHLGISNDIYRGSRYGGDRNIVKDDYRDGNVHCESYHDSHPDNNRGQRGDREEYFYRQQPPEPGASQRFVAGDGVTSHVLTQEGAMLLRKEQERRIRELAKDVDLTSQMELMANFEASF